MRVIGGRYALDREVGRGGMGAVWLAHDELLGREVAVKRVGTPPGGTSPDVLRAEREARIAARISHHHVVAVFDLVEEDGEQWLVMEYVDGATLAEQIRVQGPAEPDLAARLVGQAAEALTVAHQNGIIHRDVKPSNLLVGRDGEVKLSDFGIARAEADPSLTRTGLVTGSPAYISPEVASGRPATTASDVWSLGATLFHALAGRPPYEVSDNVLGALYRIVHEEPPRLGEEAGWLGPVLAAAMSRDPAARPTMAQFADDLRAGPTGQRSTMPPIAAPAVDGEATQAMQRPPAPPPAATGERAAARRARRGVPVLPLVVGAAALALVAVIVAMLLQDDPQDLGQGAGPSTSVEPEPTTPSDTPAPPTAEAMEQFARDYVATASTDPDAGFALLTPAYQERSNAYVDFWSTVSDPRILTISADPADLTVTYVYRYRTPERGEVEENVGLELEQTDDGFLIDGDFQP